MIVAGRVDQGVVERMEATLGVSPHRPRGNSPPFLQVRGCL